MIPDWVKAEAKFLLVLGAAALIFAAGWAVEGWRMEARIAELEADRAKAAESTSQNNLNQVVAGQVRGEEIVASLTAEENQRTSTQEEIKREIRSLSSGRPCLAGAAVRLLNLPDGSKPGAVAKAAAEPLPAHAAAASDFDVAEWAIQCKSGYDTCRGRIQAIHDFYGGNAVSDDVDRAQEREEEMRQDALNEHARKAQEKAGDSAEFCTMCGESIPEGRREAVLGVQTCLEYQNDIERLNMRVN